jgi:hypothetical protein
MDRGHVILEVHHVVENQALRFADRVVADDPLLCWHLAQVNILDMVPHVRDALEGAQDQKSTLEELQARRIPPRPSSNTSETLVATKPTPPHHNLARQTDAELR